MSELNVYHHELRPDEYDEFYLKSEADKVIAELKTEIEEQKRLRDMALASVPNVLKVMKIIQHQKYKRCLDKASYWIAVSYQCVDDKHRQNAERHHHKWLELAEKFKEAK